LRVNASYPAPRAEANPGHVGWRQRFDRANGRVDQVMGGEPFRPSGKTAIGSAIRRFSLRSEQEKTDKAGAEGACQVHSRALVTFVSTRPR
jgi:hypothetical protein